MGYSETCLGQPPMDQDYVVLIGRWFSMEELVYSDRYIHVRKIIEFKLVSLQKLELLHGSVYIHVCDVHAHQDSSQRTQQYLVTEFNSRGSYEHQW